MVAKEYNDLELVVLILNFLDRRGRWGGIYFPLHTMINWLSKAVKKDGGRIKKVLKELIKKGFVLAHKKGNTISLDYSRKAEIRELIDKGIKP